MSDYTTELRYIVETSAGLKESAGYPKVNELIQLAIPKIFDFNFPIYDESYRNVLCTKILKHYYTREIGLETVGLWKLKLDTKLNEIMPYYNQLYKTAELITSPLEDVNYTREHTLDKQGENKSTGNKNTSNNATSESTDNTDYTQKYSDLPQGGLNGVVSGDYLTNVTMDNTVITNDTTTNNTGTEATTGNEQYTSTDEYIEKVKGKTSSTSYSKLLLEYRQTLINIDMMIIDELNDLFMLLW